MSIAKYVDRVVELVLEKGLIVEDIGGQRCRLLSARIGHRPRVYLEVGEEASDSRKLDNLSLEVLAMLALLYRASRFQRMVDVVMPTATIATIVLLGSSGITGGIALLLALLLLAWACTRRRLSMLIHEELERSLNRAVNELRSQIFATQNPIRVLLSYGVPLARECLEGLCRSATAMYRGKKFHLEAKRSRSKVIVVAEPIC